VLIAPASAADYPNRPVGWLIGFFRRRPGRFLLGIMIQV